MYKYEKKWYFEHLFGVIKYNYFIVNYNYWIKMQCFPKIVKCSGSWKSLGELITLLE